MSKYVLLKKGLFNNFLSNILIGGGGVRILITTEVRGLSASLDIFINLSTTHRHFVILVECVGEINCRAVQYEQ